MNRLLKTAGWIFVILVGLISTPPHTHGQQLKEMIAQAQKEGALRAQIISTASPEANKIKQAFLKRFGLNINVDISFGNESTEYQKAETALKTGGLPAFDVMNGEDGNNLNFINQGFLLKIDNWQALLAEIHPLVRSGKVKPAEISPEPFTGFSFLLGNRNKVLLYNTKLVSPDQLPQAYPDLADPKHQGKFAVPPWSSTWEMGRLVYPQDKWLQTVDTIGKNAAGVMTFAASLERILLGDLWYAQSNFEYVWSTKAKDPNAPLGYKIFKDATFMNRVLYAVPLRSRHPAAATLFGLWMTTDEGRMLLSPAHWQENVEVGQTEMDMQVREAIKASKTKVVSWFQDEKARAELKWLSTPDGKKYSEAIGRALTQRK